MAKRNIEERFVVAVPLERFTAPVWFFKRLYGWPLVNVIGRYATRRGNKKDGSSVIRVGGFEGAIAAEACRRLGFRGLERPQNPA
jgi:hypothetical protein